MNRLTCIGMQVSLSISIVVYGYRLRKNLSIAFFSDHIHVINSAIARKQQNFKRSLQFGSIKCLVYSHFSFLETILTRLENQITSVLLCYQTTCCVKLNNLQFLPAAKKDALAGSQTSNITNLMRKSQPIQRYQRSRGKCSSSNSEL